MRVDVVNERDEKVGEALRREVLPAAKNFHTAHVFLFDESGRVLLQQLGANRERHPLTWGASVAGYVFAGESYEAAIRRRALQELGVTIEPLLVGKMEMLDQQSLKFVSLFSATVTGDVTPDPNHIAAVRFMTLDEVQNALRMNPETFTPTFRKLFPFYLQVR
ncbi:MAG TPA: NUDIX domain-containing protein [Thermoanaerobaculia bacterium]|jgi:isopentenyl-diphosphate delta-isomerase